MNLSFQQLFDEVGVEVRQVNIEGKRWFASQDICKGLGITPNSSARLPNEHRQIYPIQTAGGTQNLSMINETGLITLIMSSRKAQGQRWKQWLTQYVQPSLKSTKVAKNNNSEFNINDVEVIEHKGQRVLTTIQLAQAYNVEVKSIYNNFLRNKERYQEGVHYFLLTNNEIKGLVGAIHQIEDQLRYTHSFYLWTERGAARHAKSLNTNKAWDVFDILENHYFISQTKATHQPESNPNQYVLPKTYVEALRELADVYEKKEQLELQLDEATPKAEAFDTFMTATNALTVNEIAKSFDLGPNMFFEKMRQWKCIYKNEDGYNVPYSHWVKKGYFLLKTKTYSDFFGNTKTSSKTLVTPKGQKYLYQLAKEEGLIQRKLLCCFAN
ncbi:hypothetical protein GJ688_17720 [Heliobacillus mobilis]|uniref:Bro-N domain-containing protein n=1 Tax=Heliobacterium mobile TaxID=28064 RepID=A0A6I3SNZ6_HELMO|nr:phage antirepressor KilAC domain-containing protein [Heliobacterium mobile]MTV50773.1 hypothetical protein [Heliobacterium mobile]